MVKKEEKSKFSKLGNWLKLFFLLYLFILAIELLKTGAKAIAPSIESYISGAINPLAAFAAGWFTTAIAQSSGAIGTIAATLAGQGTITLQTAIYILMGAYLGTTITALIVALITESKKEKDFRHGFEMGLAYAIYSLFMIIILLPLEYFFRIFSRTGLFLARPFMSMLEYVRLPNWVDIITNPLIEPLKTNFHAVVSIIIALIILVVALKFMGKVIIQLLGGEENARKFINKHFDSKLKAYFIGVALTGIVFSSSITISLLVPLAAARLINLKKAIPFIIGADLGTFTDIFLASTIISQTNAMATSLGYMMFGILGAIIFLPNTEFITNITRHISKKMLNISRKKALYILIAFVIIPLLMLLIFS